MLTANMQICKNRNRLLSLLTDICWRRDGRIRVARVVKHSTEHPSVDESFVSNMPTYLYHMSIYGIIPYLNSLNTKHFDRFIISITKLLVICKTSIDKRIFKTGTSVRFPLCQFDFFCNFFFWFTEITSVRCLSDIICAIRCLWTKS